MVQPQFTHAQELDRVTRSNARSQLAVLLVAAAIAGCTAANDAASHDVMMAEPVIPAGARFTAADVKFMQGMIAHHGQALAMAHMAKSHGANPQLLTFTLKIDLSQRAEIDLMQAWLRDRKQFAPDSSAHHHMAMPGMLTAEQMKQLDAAKGPAFDKMFLEMMIIHHEGALKMVADLFAANPVPEPDLFGLAQDIDFDQRAEIEKMYEMLGNL